MNETDILEVAVLSVLAGHGAEFEAAFKIASKIISASPGHVCNELRRCLEIKDRYILLVRWRTVEDHTVGFRESAAYQEWKNLLHRFYSPFPVVEHYAAVDAAGAIESVRAIAGSRLR
jgi:heme-degrading monooxygenase HmoA